MAQSEDDKVGDLCIGGYELHYFKESDHSKEGKWCYKLKKGLYETIYFLPKIEYEYILNELEKLNEVVIRMDQEIKHVKLIVAGSRNFNNYEFVEKTLLNYLSNKHNTWEIVSGTARGVDKLGERFASEYGYPVSMFPACWDEFGKAAGPIRNKQMADYADELIAFLYDNSRGTANMIKTMEKVGKKTTIISINDNDCLLKKE